MLLKDETGIKGLGKKNECEVYTEDLKPVVQLNNQSMNPYRKST